jgi:cohesin loading factor subunit SCC2
VIKLLKGLYPVDKSHSRRVDICHRIVLRLLDEDDTVKVSHLSDYIRKTRGPLLSLLVQDLAVKALSELWFFPVNDDSSTKSGIRQLTAEEVVEKLTRDPVAEKVGVIMGVSGKFPQERQSPLEIFLSLVSVSSDFSAPPIFMDCCIRLSLKKMIPAVIEFLSSLSRYVIP